MTMSMRFDLKFFRVFSKNRYTGMLLSTFHSSAKLALLSLLKEVKPSTNRKMIKLLTQNTRTFLLKPVGG